MIHEEADEYEKQSQSSGTDSAHSTSPSVLNVDPSSATPDELFTHGTVARIVGLEGSSHSTTVGDMTSGENGMAVVVEGVSRFAIKQFRQRTPWIEADVEHFVDEPVAPHDEQTVELFNTLKQLSRELIMLLRTNNARGVGLPPMVAKRLEVLIAKKDASEAGSLADFMISAVETSFPERLEFLAAVTVPRRLEKAVEILTRQVNTIKTVTRGRGSNIPVPHLIVMNRNNPQSRPRGRRGMSSGMGSSDEEDNEENDEIEELAKVLRDAGLSPEADKVAKRELQRLKRMSPSQAEYGVCRTYLETLAEVCYFESYSMTLSTRYHSY